MAKFAPSYLSPPLPRDTRLNLTDLIAQLQQSVGILGKRDIQTAAKALVDQHASAPAIRPGDDCAAIADADGFLLLAAEGMLPRFVAEEPWFAGWCGVMVNVSDVYAMGGTPIAVVDALWSQTPEASKPVWEGLQAAASAYGVPIVGGHSNCASPHEGLAVAILGRAQHLITSFDAQPGDTLMVVVDLRGSFFRHYPFWNAATEADPARLRGDLALLPELAQEELCRAGKDISMGGIAGTLLMLMETSGCGAVLDLDLLPKPAGVDLERWLTCFPSFGFLLAVPSEQVEAVRAKLVQRDLACEAVGVVMEGHDVWLKLGDDTALLWDMAKSPLTGFGPA
ncbi:sll0787 family AIR synthase-like protein [Pseudanabaena sp. FACHB-2040]|uniref:sll0787 family AIR synthase-like protein n=1 Tax=Pseudanabaena sp. FACHB-2040 TaxID=2692859 RepID=UPI001687EA57|nr:sll0787 family AIR synthase-like protein [Pseudanabaena sp. FACHB-2040]MBD2257556.1 sll0787 family AIR synthase-like protein [Pseudanabaena sp. FACHB-2040]